VDSLFSSGLLNGKSFATFSSVVKGEAGGCVVVCTGGCVVVCTGGCVVAAGILLQIWFSVSNLPGQHCSPMHVSSELPDPGTLPFSSISETFTPLESYEGNSISS
jgi:hypothetical protein